ncbi:hypothetical protein Tcan_08700 [Toxocara canis]|uniref:Uncharacterized protein n=1 Tax=Toxocara canis TaxID=6265 RepID=A0A0B2VES3_TOXCA|nr:hypothetical protein Tcan_08700 [Toxocara canis]
MFIKLTAFLAHFRSLLLERVSKTEKGREGLQRTKAMGAVLIVFILAAIGTGVAYKMGYLDKVIAKAQDNLAGGRSPSQ